MKQVISRFLYILVYLCLSGNACLADLPPEVLLSTHGVSQSKELAALDNQNQKQLLVQSSKGEKSSVGIDEELADVPISTRAKLLVRELGLSHLVVELYKAKQEEISPDTKIERRLEILYFRQKISDNVRHSTLQVQDTVSAIDLDIAHTLRLYDYLDHKKSKYDQKANLVTFLASGLFTVLNGAFGYIPTTVHPVNTTGILAGSSSALLPFLSYRKHRYANPDASTEAPNMLAQVFDKPTDERTKYNSIVWKFLNSPDRVGDQSRTRRQRIISEWTELRELRRVSKRDIDVLTGIAGKGEKVTLDILNARVDLLSDLRAEISDYYRDLAHLQQELLGL